MRNTVGSLNQEKNLNIDFVLGKKAFNFFVVIRRNNENLHLFYIQSFVLI